jgi:putative N6-adenine-specific DNA methylase
VKTSPPPNSLSIFAVTAPGLEPLCAGELAALGLRGRVEEGGVAWRGDMDSVMRANLWLRTASRVIVRIAEFRAKAFFELELNAKKIPWKAYVKPGSRAEFRVTARKSKLYHTGAIAERLGDAVRAAVSGVTVDDARRDDEDEMRGAQLFVVRFVHDVATISVDTSGALLHLRGYRQQLAKAPLRETLAAALLVAAGWDGTAPLVDPMCGSGTIAIEAARIARRIAPGRDRSFAFLDWPRANRDRWNAVVAAARANELARAPVSISASDRDAGAVDAARANAARAGVVDDLALDVRPISALPDAPPPGLIAINPPYGVRVGERDRLRNLYAQLGNVVRRRRPGWTLALLSADKRLDAQVGLAFEQRVATKNGGIPVRVVVAGVPRA